MKLVDGEPTFLRIAREDVRPSDGEPVTVEATLCRRHRDEIWRQNPTARGRGQLGVSCEFCEESGKT